MKKESLRRMILDVAQSVVKLQGDVRAFEKQLAKLVPVNYAFDGRVAKLEKHLITEKQHAEFNSRLDQLSSMPWLGDELAFAYLGVKPKPKTCGTCRLAWKRAQLDKVVCKDNLHGALSEIPFNFPACDGYEAVEE